MKQELKQRPNSRYVWLIVIFWLGFALRLYGLGDVAVNNDESIDYNRWISESFRAILIDDTVLNNQSFAHIVDRVALLILGDTLFTLRWPSLCISVLGLGLIYRVARSLFDGRVGLVSALLLAISPYSIFFAHTFRGYGWVIVWPLLIYMLGLVALKTGQWRYWLALGVLAALMLYTHLFTTFAFFNLILLFGLVWLFGDGRDRRSKRVLVKLTTAVTITVVILLGLYASIWIRALQAITAQSETGAKELLWIVRPSVSASIWYNLWLFNGFWQKGSQAGHGVYILIALILMAIGLGFSRGYRVQILILLGWAILPFGQVWLARQILTDFWARPPYLGYTLPPLLILAGFAIVQLPGYAPFKKLPAPLNLGLIPLLLLGMFWYVGWREYYQDFAGGAWQAIGNYLQQDASTNDLVICHRYGHGWREVELDAEDLCTRTLNYRAKADTNMITAVSTDHQLVYNILPNANSGLINRVGRVRLVVWDIPTSAAIPPGESPGVTVTEFNRFGRSLVLDIDRPASYAANLAQGLTMLSKTANSPAQSFSYNLMIAPLAAATGQPELAQEAMAIAARNMPDHPEARPKFERTTSMVKNLTPLAIDRPRQENFGDQIMLLGYNIDPAQVTPGSLLQLTFFWQALKPVEKDYSVFIHVRNQAGQTVAQLDYRPFDNSYPTRHWQPGQILTDSREFVIPAEFRPGEYQLMVGFYDPTTMARLPLLHDKSGENAFHLTSLTVLPAPP